MLNRIKSNINNLRSKYYLKMINGFIKKINIEDHKIVFYIDNNKLDENKSETLGYNCSFNDTSIFKYNKSVITKNNLNKPIYYVIENMDFDDKVSFNINNVHLILRNCIFTHQVELYGTGEVILENNVYLTQDKHILIDNPFIKINTNSIKFNNENLKSLSLDVKANTTEIINSTFEIEDRINIESEEIDIISSKISCPDISINTKTLDIYKGVLTSENGTLDINANESFLDSSCLYTSLISLNSNKIESKRTRIISKNGIILENINKDKIENICAPIIINNGQLETSNTELILSIKRNKLLNTLRNIKILIKNKEIEKLKQIQDNLETQSIRKTLKIKE